MMKGVPEVQIICLDLAQGHLAPPADPGLSGDRLETGWYDISPTGRWHEHGPGERRQDQEPVYPLWHTFLRLSHERREEILLGTAPLETSHGDRDTVLVGSVTDFWLAQL